jgi:hypothetical protein
MSAAAVDLPPPLVKPNKHPVRWLVNEVEILGVGAVITYLGVLTIVALYYLVLETKWKLPFMAHNITQEWHKAVPNSDERHTYRAVGEGFYGGMLAHVFVWDHYKRIRRKFPWDKLEIKFHIPNLKDDRRATGSAILAVIPLALIYALPGYLVGSAIASEVSAAAHHAHGTLAVFGYNPQHHVIATSGSWWDTFKASLAENWPKKVIGFSAAFFFGRRPVKGVYDDMQLLLVERRIRLGRPPRWYHTPPFKARYNDVVASGSDGLQTGMLTTAGIRLALLVGAGLAAYGWYVLQYIAK